ncbi:uncharacterized protein TM35_000351440 [Trypanosoma theileri]|uniref:Uncharacterized protein n=1 Tax=Trypanosoma theileri TaxID=67003 RepID=A0A1X0NMP9_9TRYP|nr:uncharacterized protein TM35_000351440 [Trypanosoma theileri]ORC85400.1 hypothetical protein TM35_000351440 [Trypanosoma theileri]
MSDKSRRSSGGSGRGLAEPQLHSSRRASPRSRSGGNDSGERQAQRRSNSGGLNDKERGRDAVPTSGRHHSRSGSDGSMGDKYHPRRSGSGSSRAFTKSPVSEQMKATPLRNSNGRQENSRSRRDYSQERGKAVSHDELLHLLRKKGSLTDIRPDMYRLDLKQKDDLRFLYETQHRVDPELVPISKHITPGKWKQMNQSHIFDPPPPPTPQKKPTSDKKKDGLGTIARFLLNAEDQTKSPARGRSHRHCNASGSALWLFGGNDSNGVGENINDPRFISPRRGTRLVPNHPSDQLGRDLLAREPLSGEIAPRHGVRTMKAVQAFEATQPKLTLPPRKQSARFTNAMRTHSAGGDNDILGVRGRREHMMRRSRSASVPSNDPYGHEEEDRTMRPRSSKPRSTRSQTSSRRSETRSETRSQTRSECSMERRSNAPFGEEEESRVNRTRRHHGSSHHSSRHNSSSCGSVTSSPSVKNTKRPHSHSSRRSDSGRGSHRRNDGTESYVSSSYETGSYTTSAMWEEEERHHQKLRNHRQSEDLLVSPRIRTGRARVPGHSITASHIVFGDERPLKSPRVVKQSTQLRSPQMHNILTWA